MFRVQWGGSGAFVAKNSDATSWHEHFATKPPDPPHWTLNSCFGVFRTIGCVRCEKFRRDFVARTFEQVRTVLHQFCKETKRSQMVRNATKHEFRVQWGGSGAFVVKNTDTTSSHEFCTCSARFPPSFVRQPNGPECTQIVQNAPERQFGVQWGGSSAFVAKNSDATLWHELLH